MYGQDIYPEFNNFGQVEKVSNFKQQIMYASVASGYNMIKS